MELASTVVVLVALATCSAVPIETEWDLWKEQHAKTYLNGKEEFEKKITWARNAKFIEDFNQGQRGYKLAMNHFSDMVRFLLLSVFQWFSYSHAVTGRLCK